MNTPSFAIKPLWKKHPLALAGKVEEIPTEWVWQYYGPDVSPLADLKDGTMVDVEGLWKNILEEGLHDPLIMRAGLGNKKFRLEAGNHRIQAYHKYQIPTVPVVVQLRDECGPHLSDVLTDASHNFDAGDEFLIDSITEEYKCPSEVFRSLRSKAGNIV